MANDYIRRPGASRTSGCRWQAGTTAVGVALTLWCRPAPVRAEDTAPGHIDFRGGTAVGPSVGEFRRWQIRRAVIDEEHPARSEVVVVVDLASLDTANSMRDRHLRGEDFFAVDRYPVAEVRLHDFVLDDPTHFTAQVDLDPHGYRHTFPMQFTVDRDTRPVVGDVTLLRSDYDIGPHGWFFNPLRVADEVAIHVDTVVPAATVSTEREAVGADEPPQSASN